jgi:hypothetical protein
LSHLSKGVGKGDIVSSSSASQIGPSTDVEDELRKLRVADLPELQRLWHRWMGGVPKHLSADLLRRRLAYEIQVRTRGDLKPSVQRRLAQLDTAFQVDPHYFPAPHYALTPGTVLVRVWRGRAYKVQVLEGRFSYGGRTYESLSEIASSITGAKWSGAAFFGLQRDKR